MDHWTRNKGRARIGRALEDRGARLYGWKEDRSDSMTDYYDPERWDGVATVTGPGGTAVIGVCLRDHERRQLSANQPTERVHHDRGPCQACDGTGRHPSGLTLDDWQKDPDGTETALGADGVKMFNVVPAMTRAPSVKFLPADKDPERHAACRECNGHARVSYWTTEPVGEPWPEIRHDYRRGWHVELNGRKVASGVASLARCAESNYPSGLDRPLAQGTLNLGERKAAEVADAIIAAARRAVDPPAPRDTARRLASGTVAAFYNSDKDGIEIQFSEKPDDETRSSLKREGFRWSRRQGLWWARYTTDRAVFAELLTGNEVDGAPPAEGLHAAR